MNIPNQMYINGQWVESSDGSRTDIIDPATEQRVDSVPNATDADLSKVLEAADLAWRQWREVDAWTRSRVLRRAADLIRQRTDDIALVLTEEQGKPLAESRGEISAAIDQFDWFADEARRIYGRMIEGHSKDHRLLVMRQPVGPVAAFVPWNFPVLLSARKIAPAIAAGCSIIVLPAIEAPRTILCLAAACEEAGVPPGVVNVVTGDPDPIGKRLIESDVIRKISLTASIPVGKKVLRQCAEGLKVASMELGGLAPVLVFEDTDVERVAELTARSKFRNNGQVCIAGSRFYVQESIIEPFAKRFVEVTKSLKIGDGRDPDTDIGPLANRRRLDATEALVADAVGKGASVRSGGCRPSDFSQGFFYEPTVLTGIKDTMKVMSEEPFGPIAPITSFTDLDDALEKANATPIGLAGYVFTNNTRTAFLASERLDVGMVGVNNMVISTAEAPFGGVKHSGFGREGGSEGIEAYTVAKYVNILL